MMAHIFRVIIFAFCPLLFGVSWNTSSVIFDSSNIKAYIGQSDPSGVNAGALFTSFFDESPRIRACSTNSPAISRSLTLTASFQDTSALAFVDYVFKPIGSFAETVSALNFSSYRYSTVVDSLSLPFGAYGYVRAVDMNGNMLMNPVSFQPSMPYKWSFRPNRWYAVRPTRNSKRLLNKLTSRPNLLEGMGDDFLFCYYSNGGFHDYSKDDNFNSLKTSDAFLVYLKEPFVFDDTLESVFQDSAYGPLGIVLKAGWNLVVTPFLYPISVSNVASPDSISPFFTISDSSDSTHTYYHVHSSALLPGDTMRPFEGFWVFAYVGGARLRFYPYQQTYPYLPKASSTNEWVMEIRNSKANILLGEAKGGAYRIQGPPAAAAYLASDNGYVVNIKDYRGEGNCFELNLPDGLNTSFRLVSGCPYERAGVFIVEDNRFIEIPKGAVTDLAAGNYFKAFVLAGSSEYIQAKMSDIASEFPKEFAVSQNYPNPFNPATRIDYAVPLRNYGENMTFSVYGIDGKIVYSRQERALPGKHSFEWRSDKIPSGYYIGRLSLKNNSKTIKMVVIK